MTWNICRATGKRRYEQRHEAARALRSVWRRVKRGKLPRRVYWCPQCKGFHLTSQEPRR